MCNYRDYILTGREFRVGHWSFLKIVLRTGRFSFLYSHRGSGDIERGVIRDGGKEHSLKFGESLPRRQLPYSLGSLPCSRDATEESDELGQSADGSGKKVAVGREDDGDGGGGGSGGGGDGGKRRL